MAPPPKSVTAQIAQPFWRERRAEAVSNRGPSTYQPNTLLLAKPAHPW